MNFINHTKPGSLDSGDAIECISAGTERARLLLNALDADMSTSSSSRTAFGRETEELRAWTAAAEQLLDATADESIEGTIEFYIQAAEQHGKDDDPDHEVGDLQDYLRDMWQLLTPQQHAAFAASPAVRDRVQLATDAQPCLDAAIAESWMADDSERADAEGWNLFDADGDRVIERDTQAEEFASDQDALRFVVAQASRGSPLHQKALRLSRPMILLRPIDAGMSGPGDQS